jgi:hypothetical protein
MMPSPPAGASHGDPIERQSPPDPGNLCHLACRCQDGAAPPLTLCGVPFPPPKGPDHEHRPCAVCHDLARTVLIAGRCERCVP